MNFFSISTIVLSLSLLVASLPVRHKAPAPTVISYSEKKTEGCFEDPLSPCITETIVVKNPLFTPVIVTMTCGIDDQQEVQVPARTQLTVDIELTTPSGRTPSCQMTDWRKVQ